MIMKQNIKHIIITAALLLGLTEMWGAGVIKIITPSNGTVTSAVNGTTVTLTAVPSEGYYITADNFTVEKTIDGSQAGATKRTPGMADLLTVTATDPTADPSGVTTYTFTLDEDYDAEVTADFQQRTSIDKANIVLEKTSYVYTGKALEPAIESVIIGTEQELSEDDYSIAYTDNTNAGTATVTLTGVRTYTGTASTTFSIAKANATIFFPQEEYVTYMDSVLTTPKLIIHPATIKVRYTSSNEEVATVNAETGEVHNIAVGETDITAYTDDDNCEPAQVSYKLTVEKAQGYRIYVNNTLVTKANKDNVLNDGDIEQQIAPSVIYGPETNTIVLTSAKDITIDCERTDSLRIYLLNSNYVTSINSSKKCPLIFTTDGAFPGNLKLKNLGGRVTNGFSDVKYEYNLQLLEGDLTSDSAYISVELRPIVEKITQTTPAIELVEAEKEAEKEAEETGGVATVKMIHNDFLYTYTTDNNNGPDLSDGTYVLNTPSSNEEVKNKLANFDVNSNEYADKLNAITFRLSPGEYLIDIDADYYGDMELALRTQGTEPYHLKQPIEDIVIKTNEIVIVAVYAVKRTSSAYHRIGRKTTASVAISSLTVTPIKMNSCNAVSSTASSYPTETLKNEAQNPANDKEITENEIISEKEYITGIQKPTHIYIDLTKDNKVYDLQGRTVCNPTKPGLYISQGKKIVVR